MSHYHDPTWSSAGFLRQAKGPLADRYKAMLPEAPAWYRGPEKPAGMPTRPPEENDFGDGEAKDANKPAHEQWSDDIAETWEAHRAAFVQFSELTEDQIAETQKVLAHQVKLVREYLKENAEDIEQHLRELDRLAELKAEESASNIPYQQSRVAQKEKELASQAANWQANIERLQQNFHSGLNTVLREGQAPATLPLVEKGSRLETVDRCLTYGLIIAGGCLVIGLFTRLAAVAAALFLLSVILSQPPWVPGTTPTYNQFVEMFALLTLATTTVGRWAGFDFFIHHLIQRLFRPMRKVIRS